MQMWGSPPGAPLPQGAYWMQQQAGYGAGYAAAFPRMDFKFVFVKGGRPGVFGKPGAISPEGILLDGAPLPYAHVVATETRDRRIVLVLDWVDRLDPRLAANLHDGRALVIEIRSPAARDVEIAIDRIASRHAAERTWHALNAQGRAHEYRVMPCPHCGATVDLSSFPATHYVYCRFCSSVFMAGQPASGLGPYRACDDCSMFDRVQSYTEFYFYFLLIAYGFSMRRRHVCDACAGRLFWKTFLINFVFVLGIPSAIWIKIKSMSGRDPGLANLARANAFALKGKVQEARALYAELHGRMPNHPGLLVNEARGHVAAKDLQSALGCLQAALRACSNYGPAQELMDLFGQVAGGAPAAFVQSR